MKNRMSLTVTDPADRSLIENLSGFAVNIQASSTVHGYEGLSFEVPDRRLITYSRIVVGSIVQLSTGAEMVWEGRIENLSHENGGLQVTAVGRWAAADDVSISSTYVSKGLDDWNVLREDDYSFAVNGRFNMNSDGGLYWTTKEGARYTTTTFGMFYFQLPADDSESIIEVQFSYEQKADSGWRLQLQGWPTPWSSADAAAWTLDSDGTLQTSTATVAISSRSAVTFSWFRHTSTLDPETNDEGTQYARITDLTVRCIADPIKPDAIVKDIVGQVAVNAAAPTQFPGAILSLGISDDLATIKDVEGVTAMDITDLAFRNTSAQKAMQFLAQMGNLDGEQVGVAVWQDGRVEFDLVANTSHDWHVDASDLRLEETLEDVYNSIIIVKKDENLRDSRLAEQSSAASIDYHGVRRQFVLHVDTKCNCVATSFRDTIINRYAFPPPRMRILLDQTQTGADYWQIRGNDNVIVRNAPFDLVDGISSNTLVIRAESVVFDVDAGVVEITPLHDPRDPDTSPLAVWERVVGITNIGRGNNRQAVYRSS